MRTEEEWVSGSAAQPRLNAVLLGAFAAAALVVAAIGIYGVLAYSVTQRRARSACAWRSALSARGGAAHRPRRHDRGRVGIALGGIGALALSRVLANLVFGVPVHDPMTFSVVAGILTVVALAACVLPARRASRVDPLVALEVSKEHE